MNDQETKNRISALRVALVNWVDMGEVIGIGCRLILEAQRRLSTPNPMQIAKGGNNAEIAKAFAAVPVTEERVLTFIRSNTDFPTVFEYLWERAHALISSTERTLEQVPFSAYASSLVQDSLKAFNDQYEPYDFHFGMDTRNGIGPVWELHGDKVEEVAIVHPFRTVKWDMHLELLKRVGRWQRHEPIGMESAELNTGGIEPGVPRIQWTCSTAVYVHIVKELFHKGYIAAPDMNGKEGEANITELFRRLSQAFIVTGKKGNVLKPDELQRRFDGRKLAEAKAARLTLPEAKEVK